MYLTIVCDQEPAIQIPLKSIVLVTPSDKGLIVLNRSSMGFVIESDDNQDNLLELARIIDATISSNRPITINSTIDDGVRMLGIS